MPPQVADAVLKVLAYRATHMEGEEQGEAFKALFEGGVASAMLVAGAVLRVKDLPPQSGIKLSTGLYA